MDTLRGNFDSGTAADDYRDFDTGEADDAGVEAAHDLPPEAIGQDERRMQVRAYNHWAGMLGDATFPSIEDLEPHNIDDFGPNSVLLDFSAGIDDPLVQYLGSRLAEECGGGLDENGAPIQRLSDVPPRSLLSRITDHYMQILANQAPIGFEAEFVNDRGAAILYRGILLPYSSDGETIDFIYGVINWKEMADAATADELLLEIDQALGDDPEEPVEDEDEPQKHHADALTEWADSPSQEAEGSLPQPDPQEIDDFDADPGSPAIGDNIASFNPHHEADEDNDALPLPDFGQYGLDEPEVDEFGEEIEEDGDGGYSFASLADYIEAPAKKAVDLDADRFDPEDYKVEDTPAQPVEEPTSQETFEPVDAIGDEAVDYNEDELPPLELGAEDVVEEDVFELPASSEISDEVETPVAGIPLAGTPVTETPIVETPVANETAGETEQAGLHDCLASARELAENARASEDRSRNALYAAVGRAYDVSLAAEESPEEYAELIEDSGLTVQDRAPMTPIVKLVFGHDYDKTRLTEYAAVLAHAHRLELERGRLAGYLGSVEGGLKGVVAAERRLRREEAGEQVEDEGEVRAKLAQKLRELDEIMLEALDGVGPEFSLVMLRRDGDGKVALIGEVSDDVALIERVGKKLVG